jgi:hypothetical protein
MKLKDIKNNALKIINEYSYGGIDKGIMDNYDFLKRANIFINDSQQEIASIKKIREILTINQIGIDIEGYNYHALPSDMNELRYVNFGSNLFFDYKVVNGEIFVPKKYEGVFTIYYYKNPAEITSSTSDDYSLEIANNLHNFTAYYCAAMLIIPINMNLGDRLLNLYYSKLKTIVPEADDNYSVIIDVTGW